MLSQNPTSGTRIDTGSTVALTVAKAPSQVAVPDVTGEDAPAAIAALSGQGFKIDQQSQDVATPDGDGVVLEQSPAGGQEGQEGLDGDDHGRQVQPRPQPRGPDDDAARPARPHGTTP